MTEEEIKNKISEHKECCKKLAEEYRQRYNENNADKLALNMFYHNVISYNDFETVLSIIEDRNSMMMCFSEPPYLTEETVEVNVKRIAELEAENAELKADNDARKFAMAMSEKVEKQLREENTELKLKLEALDGQTPWKDIKDKSEVIGKLTNAKELLKNILAISVHDKRQCTYDAYILTVKEAEQFLNSEVEK